MTRNDIKNI